MNSHKLKKKLENIPAPQIPNSENNTGNSYEETVNVAGITNSVIGAGIVEVSKAVFTRSENNPATKKDIQNLLSQVQERYKPIMNMRPNPDGKKPFYDIHLKAVVFLTIN